MNKNCRILLLTAFALTGTAAEASAASYWLRCRTCDMTEIQRVAETMPPGEHVIYGLGTTYAFWNEWQVQGANCQPNALAPPGSKVPPKAHADTNTAGCSEVMVSSQRPLEAWELEGVKDLRAIDLIAGAHAKAEVEITVDADNVGMGPVGQGPASFGGPNAYDFANNVVLRARVEQFAARAVNGKIDDALLMIHSDRTGAWERITSLTRDVVFGDVKVTAIKVVFPDGSYVILEVNVDRPNNPETKEVKDSENRDVMTKDNLDQFVGVFAFENGGENSLQNWLENARLLGVVITNVASGGAPHGSVSCHH